MKLPPLLLQRSFGESPMQCNASGSLLDAACLRCMISCEPVRHVRLCLLFTDFELFVVGVTAPCASNIILWRRYSITAVVLVLSMRIHLLANPFVSYARPGTAVAAACGAQPSGVLFSPCTQCLYLLRATMEHLHPHKNQAAIMDPETADLNTWPTATCNG